jgi:hypothetical protein
VGRDTVEAAGEEHVGREHVSADVVVEVEHHPALVTGLGKRHCAAGESEPDHAVIGEASLACCEAGRVAVLVLQVAEGRELARLARGRVEQPDDESVAVLQEQEALGGSGSEHAVVNELWDVHLDALAGGDVQEAATAAVQGVGVEHDPPVGAEARVVQDAAAAALAGSSQHLLHDRHAARKRT